MRTTEKCQQILVTGPNTSQKYRKAKYRKRKDAARGGDGTKGPKSGRKGSYVIPGQRAAKQPHGSVTAGVTSGATRKTSVRERLAAVVARRALKRMGGEMDVDLESGELAAASGGPSSENSDLTVRNRAMPSKQRTISAGGGVSSKPRAEMEFTTVKQEPIDTLAEIESIRVKAEPTEPSDEREAGNANATEMLKAEIELTLSVAESSDAEVSVVEDDEMDIEPITDEQVKIIMKGKAKEKKRLKNSVSNSANCAPASNRVNWKSIHRGTLTEVSASNAAQAALKASQVSNANKRKIVLNAVVPPAWPKRCTPIILKNAAAAKSPSLLPTVLDRMSPSPPGARPDQALVPAVPTQPSSTAANVKLNLNLQLNCKKQNEKYLLQSLPGMLFGNRGKQRMNRNRPSGRPRRTVRELIGGDQMPKIVDVRSEDLSQYSGDELWNKVVGKNSTPGLDDILSRISPSVDKTPVSSPCPCSSACDASIDQGPTTPKPALENPDTGPKILEVHSENLSAYTGDELWSKIIQASPSSQSPCKSSSVDAVSKITDNSAKVVQVLPGESIQDKVAKVFPPKRSKHPGFGVRLVDRGVGRLENKKKAYDKAEIVWDSIFGRSSKDTTNNSSGTGPSVSDVKVKVETFETEAKAVPLDEKAAGNNSDSESDQERVLLRADDVPVDPSDEADPAAKQTETILSNSVNLNPSFQGFTNAQPITIHIPLPPRPQPKPQAEPRPNKKFFKSARDTKSKFDKGKFIASAIQEAGAKFQVEFPEQVRERKKVKKIGSRVNPRSLTCHDWQRRYAYSLPQGGDVIRKVGIVKEISSANPFLNTCDICGEMFKYSACLRKHIKTHTEFHCDICDCDFQSKKLYDKHIDIFHSFLSDRIKPGKPDNRTNTSDDKDLERYFSFVNGSDEDADRDRELQWQKCYEQNGLVGPGLKLKTEVAVAEDDESLHSSDSDVQDGDVFAPLSNPVSGPSEVEWARIVAK